MAHSGMIRAVVAPMQSQSPRPVRTFTIGFYQREYYEATHAKAVADYLSIDHTELYVRPEDALAIILKLPSMYCEPFSGSFQIRTCLISQMAKQHVTVALSGYGGDELFGGYNRYMAARKVWGLCNGCLPLPATQLPDCCEHYPRPPGTSFLIGRGSFCPNVSNLLSPVKTLANWRMC